MYMYTILCYYVAFALFIVYLHICNNKYVFIYIYIYIYIT